MTTEEMKLALLCHFRYSLKCSMVATECLMATPTPSGSSYQGSSMADILAIGEGIMVEVEIKQYRSEIRKDLESKPKKHAFYLRTTGIWENWYDSWEKDVIRPHKFYFALPRPPKKRKKRGATAYPDIPTPYGLIVVNKLYDCKVVKRAGWLHRDLTHLEDAKQRMLLRLAGENLYLRIERLKGYERSKEAK